MIGRSPIKASHVLVVSVLTASLAFASFVTQPSAARAADGDPASASHSVTFIDAGKVATTATTAFTVGEFLAHRGIIPRANDSLVPGAFMPVSEGMTIAYRAAVPVKLIAGNRTRIVQTSAINVEHFIADERITLHHFDIVRPSLNAPLVKGSTIRIVRYTAAMTTVKERIGTPTIHRLDFDLSPGSSRVLSQGAPGLKLVKLRRLTGDDGSVQVDAVGTRILRHPKPRVIADGVSRYDAVSALVSRSFAKTSYEAIHAMRMVATAYTPWCTGCSGTTASGYHAGRGIVAVDPRVIPLGTKLYIPGYGFAVAGDTGGAIIGDRIDLGFESEQAALIFGRRVITVYRLK